MARRESVRLSLHPEVLTKNGRKEFVVLPYEEFKRIQERLEDAQDLMDLRRAVQTDKGGPGMSLSELKLRLGMGRKEGRKSMRARRVSAV